jgi:hypothetical protein
MGIGLGSPPWPWPDLPDTKAGWPKPHNCNLRLLALLTVINRYPGRVPAGGIAAGRRCHFLSGTCLSLLPGPFPLQIFKEQARERRTVFILPHCCGNASKRAYSFVPRRFCRRNGRILSEAIRDLPVSSFFRPKAGSKKALVTPIAGRIVRVIVRFQVCSDPEGLWL